MNFKKQSGKIVYVTALLPYAVLIILGIQGWILDGAEKGVVYFINPDWSKLSNFDVWKDAAGMKLLKVHLIEQSPSICY